MTATAICGDHVEYLSVGMMAYVQSGKAILEVFKQIVGYSRYPCDHRLRVTMKGESIVRRPTQGDLAPFDSGVRILKRSAVRCAVSLKVEA